jgi:hypothetical protein
MESIAKRVKKWIEEHPVIKHCLAKEMINYSELARRIQKELRIKNFDAVIVAVRRISYKLKEARLEEEIIRILKRSKLNIKTKINVAILRKGGIAEGDFLAIIEGVSSKVVIYEADAKVELSDRIKEWRDLAAFILISPEEIEVTPGVVHSITEMLFEHGINVIEFMSCHRDTILILEKKDIAKALEIFQRIC